MDIKERRKQYYLNNRDKILEKSKQYYHDNYQTIKKKDKNIIMNIGLYMGTHTCKKEV